MIMSSSTTTTLVVGATGATGKHVVLQLLQQKQNVRAIARSKDRLLASLDEIVPKSSEEFANNLEVTEAAVLDLSNEELQKVIKDCDAVVSCLGHNMTFNGMFGNPRRLVTEATRRLCSAIEENRNREENDNKKATKFILMGSEGVANPSGGDDKRSFGERVVLFLLRYLIPPHRDNEQAAEYIFSKTGNPKLEWTVVRPTDLVDGPAKKYELFEKPQGSLFSGTDVSVATRATVAKSMVDLILANDLWEEWKFKMPVIHDLN